MEQRKDKYQIGLALGAGGAKGFAHIGVLKVLEEARIPIDLIVGCSIGSVVGGFFASGISARQMEMLATNLNYGHLVDLSIPQMGLLKGEKIYQLLRLLTQSKSFADLKFPFAVVAVDLEKGEKTIVQEGLVADAIRASISIPGIFRPASLGEKLLVDGAVIEPVPVPTARELGADLVIAVDVRFGGTEARDIKNIYDVIMRSIEILERQVFVPVNLDADLIIQPNLVHINPNKYTHAIAEECIALGEAAARAVLPDINDLLKRL